MSAILRVSGESFDVDSFVEGTTLKIIKIFRKGEKRNPKSKPNVNSGINIEVSSIDFDNYKGQLDESLEYLESNEEELIRLQNFTGIESIYIDYGAEIYPPGWCSFYFPHALLLKAGELRIDLGLSVYPTDNEDSQ